jgi:hypothetical protein
VLEKMKRTRRRVKKEDYTRILLTETTPYDVPLVFSNVGFYWHWKKHSEGKSLFKEFMDAFFGQIEFKDYTIPHSFKIRKDQSEYRNLALIHPRSQIRFIELYKTFDEQILLACQKSRFSIRFPEKIGSKYYVRNLHENRQKYKSRAVSRSEIESRSRYLSTYFSYKSHTRLYKFFDSVDFRRLEKKYTTFWSIDVGRCFDSVYTHSITWALKEKAYSKTNRAVTNSLGPIFDRLMQATNYNETAGILIGAEVSRIFAEIIFQEIDRNVLNRLREKDVFEGVHYTIRRYVDDIFIFSTTPEIATKVHGEVADALKEYKLSINLNKTQKIPRPFITTQSKAIKLVKKSYQNLVEKLLKTEGEFPNQKRVPNYLFNRNQLLNSFLQEIKLACFDSVESYSIVAGYLISAFSNLLMNFADANLNAKFENEKEASRFKAFFYFTLEAIFHLYTINPSSNGSIKIGLVVQRTCDFFDSCLPSDANSARSLIYTLSIDFFESGGFCGFSRDNNNNATLEALNVLCAIKILGSNFLVSRQILESIVDLKTKDCLSYFEITTLLYYIGDDKEGSFGAVKKAVVKSIKAILSDISDIRENSEKTHLLLDVLACPFIEEDLRKRFVIALWCTLHLGKLDDAVALQLTRDFSTYPWFTSWDAAEVLSTLEKKALLRSY